jgi:hypothetical protein
MSSDYFRQYRAGLKSPIPAAAFSFCQISGFDKKEMRAAGNRFYYGPIPPGVGITDFP